MLHIKHHCFFPPYGPHGSDLGSFTARVCMLQSAFLKVMLHVSPQKYRRETINDLSCKVWAGTTKRRMKWKKNEQAEQTSSLFSSTSPSLSLHGTYLSCLLSTTVVRTCEENALSNSSPATATLAALAIHHPEITSSFVNICLAVRGLGT